MDEIQTAGMPVQSMAASPVLAQTVNEPVPQAGETVQPATDEYSGHGGSYVVDAVTQMRKLNK